MFFISKMRKREYLQNLVDEYLFRKEMIEGYDLTDITDEQIPEIINDLPSFLKDKTGLEFETKLIDIESNSVVENNQIIRKINRFVIDLVKVEEKENE